MNVSSQNLRDGKRFNRRFWLRRSGDWYERRFGQLEVQVAAGGSRWGLTFGGGDDGRELGATFSIIPGLLTIYLTLSQAFAQRRFGYDFDRGDDRQISVYWHNGGIWWSFWVGSMASWSKSYPWCRPWRQGHFDFASLLGKRLVTTEVLREGIPVAINMPEGAYPGLAKVERTTWKRPLWFPKTRVSTYIEATRGVPFAGKGENSWDCGDDGLWGCGFEGTDPERAAEQFRDKVLAYRKKNGQPSRAALASALAT